MDFQVRPTATEQFPPRDDPAPEATQRHLRRQHNVLFGGGVIVSAVLVIATFAGLWLSACDYVAGRYAGFVQHVGWMQRDIAAREQLLRVEHYRGKAVWTGRSSSESEVTNAFSHGRGELLMQGNGGTAPILVAGDLHAPPAMGFARLLSFAREFSDRIYAYSIGRGALLDSYFYSADGSFIGIVPIPARPLPRRRDATIDTRALIHSMMPDYSPGEARANSGIETVWLQPASNPLTGRTVIRAVSKVDADGRPFLVFVSEMAVDTLLARLGRLRPDEIAWIANIDGKPIVLAGSARSEHVSIMTALTKASLPALDGMKPDIRHQDGRMVFRAALPGAGWVVYQTMTWRTVLQDMWREYAVVVGLLIGSIVVLWGLLLAVNRRRMPHVRTAEGFEILIADDYPVTRNILRDRLAELGHGSDVADDGMSALRMTIGKRYQLLMTDLNMPGMNGYTLARMVRDRDASMPIIAITAHVTEHERTMCTEAGIDEILMKSASLVEIDDAIRRAVERHGSAVLEARGRADPVDETLPASVRQALLSTLAASVDRINDAIARLDAKAVLGELHSIKGAFAMVREMAIVQLCEQFECFAREGTLPTVEEINALAEVARDALARRV